MRTRFTLRPLAANRSDHPWRRRWFGTGAYWLCQLAGWGVIGSLFLLANISSARPHAWVVPTFMFSGGLFCTHLLRIAILRLRAQARSWVGFLSQLAVWVVFLGMGMTGITHVAAFLFAPELFDRTSISTRLAYLVPVVEMSVLFSGWAGLYLGIAYFRGYQKSEQARLQLENAVKDAELRVLKAQIDPHFLFNSLNTVRSLATDNPVQARDAITLLADILRAALMINTRETISLAEELDNVRSYLSLEQLRFEERLRVQWSIAEDTLSCPIPPSVLQTLVENALKHGIARRIDGGVITIQSTLCNGRFRLTVLNPGRLGAPALGSTGIGLENARGRLRHAFGEEASIQIEQRMHDLVAAEVAIPVRVPQPLPVIEPAIALP